MTTHATDHQVALANEITAILRERIGYHEQFAAPIAGASSAACRCRGGDVLYVPTGNRKPCQLTERNAAIRADSTAATASSSATNGDQQGAAVSDCGEK